MGPDQTWIVHPPLELPWLPMTIRHTKRAGFTIDRWRFWEFMMKHAGGGRLSSALPQLVARNFVSSYSWLRMRPSNAIRARALREAARVEMIRQGWDGQLAYWPAGEKGIYSTHLKLSIMLVFRPQAGLGPRPRYPRAQQATELVMEALDELVWSNDVQVREVQVRVQPATKQYGDDIWTVRVEETPRRDRPEWLFSPYVGSIAVEEEAHDAG